MAFIGDAGRVDGSWELTIFVTDLEQECTLRVKGDLHIGGVMLNLVQTLGKICSVIVFLAASCTGRTTTKVLLQESALNGLSYAQTQ
ncbi:hypothetical protein BaRGS_00028426 [Batillaria attramentaria]|uniref:Kindlin-2 N-terminal domain-containing protein n=1 Tax=Batillaria attramentaria TaxID=370345 RepID=A0ABD0JZD2_9CAEN